MSDAAPPFIVRPATAEDVPALLAVLNPIVDARRYTAIAERLTDDEMRSWLTDVSARRGAFHLIECRADLTMPGQTVLGWQAVEPFSPHPGAFDHVATMATFVALEHHRQGLAARLFAASFVAARALGYDKIFTYVRADNEAGRRAYRGQGFAEVGVARRQCRIDGRDIDEIMIERMLDE